MPLTSETPWEWALHDSIVLFTWYFEGLQGLCAN